MAPPRADDKMEGSSSSQAKLNPTSKPVVYAKTATDFQNNRKQKKQKKPATKDNDDTQIQDAAQSSKGKVKEKRNANPRQEKAKAVEKKTVFRTTLDNPFNINWPVVPLNIENAVLACAVTLLETVKSYHEQRDRDSKLRKNRSDEARERMQRRKNNIKARRDKSAAGGGKKKQEKEGTEGGADTTESHSAKSQPRTSINVLDAGGEKEAPKKRKRDLEEDEAEGSTPSDLLGDKSDRPVTKRPKSGELADDDNYEAAPAEGADPDVAMVDEGGIAPPTKPKPAELSPPARPEIVDHIVFGINEVTKRLEQQSLALRTPKTATTTSGAGPCTATSSAPDPAALSSPKRHNPLRLVLVCRTDIDSPMMIAHLPTLAAACNSHAATETSPGSMTEPLNVLPGVILVGLPRGAEDTLSSASGLKRVAVMAFDDKTPGLELFAPFLSSIPTLTAQWLAVPPATTSTAPLPTPSLVPTHIKQLKTTAPKNMTEAKKQRQAERTAAKEKKAGAGRSKLKPKAARQGPKVVVSGAGTVHTAQRIGKVSSLSTPSRKKTPSSEDKGEAPVGGLESEGGATLAVA